jgi:hypothetical protein
MESARQILWRTAKAVFPVVDIVHLGMRKSFVF